MTNTSSTRRLARTLVVGLGVGAVAIAALAADKKEYRYQVGAGASVSIANQFGLITLHPATGGQVLVTATPYTNKVEIDANQNGNRVTLRTHFLQKATPEEGRVDYDLQVPPDASVTIRCATGPVKVERMNGDIVVEGDTAPVEVHEVSNAHVHVRTVDGPISLTDIRRGHVEITSVGGEVTLNNVGGNLVSVNTTGGNIHYQGDFATSGDYTMITHSGDIDVTLPAGSSVDVTARSVKGSVQNDFPLRPQKHPTMSITQGKSFAGTSSTGASSVRLRSFSGKIRVKKE